MEIISFVYFSYWRVESGVECVYYQSLGQSLNIVFGDNDGHNDSHNDILNTLADNTHSELNWLVLGAALLQGDSKMIRFWRLLTQPICFALQVIAMFVNLFIWKKLWRHVKKCYFVVPCIEYWLRYLCKISGQCFNEDRTLT